MNEKDFIEIDIEEIEPIELSDWEKINIEKSVLRSSSTKKYVFKNGSGLVLSPCSHLFLLVAAFGYL